MKWFMLQSHGISQIFFKMYINLIKSTEKIMQLIEIATNQNLLLTLWCDYFCRYTIVSISIIKIV